MAWGHIYGNIAAPDGSRLPLGTPLAIETFDDSGGKERGSGHMESDGRIAFDVPANMPAGNGLNLVVMAPGCAPFVGRGVTPDTIPGDVELGYGITLKEGPNPFA